MHEWERACLLPGHMGGVAQALLVEPLPPPLPNLALLVVQLRATVDWLQSHKFPEQREIAGDVLAVETLRQEQAHPKLRFTRGSSESTPPVLCVTVSLQNSSQHHLGGI